MEVIKTKKYLLVFSDGDSVEVEAETLPLAVSKASEKYNMCGFVRFSINGGRYTEVAPGKCVCKRTQPTYAYIPCPCMLERAEQKAA